MIERPDLPERLLLPYYVGQIVIWDSYAEHEARVFWKAIHNAGITTEPWPQEFGRLLPGLESALNVSAVPSQFRSLAFSATRHARRWHKYRRDLVHDLLATGWGKAGHVQSALGKHPARPLTEIAQCADELQLASYRFRGLWVIAPSWFGVPDDDFGGADDAESMRSWTRVAMGEVADEPHVIHGTPGPSPEPPGGWDAAVARAAQDRMTATARAEAANLEIFRELSEDLF